ncbi:hypothetical protein BSPLISOX_1135 [uncultured Gammaproteobacteria bacterium]|nr:hypothetical protein BSPLISOX_1135 [uncultured Gammaproteobacteria bacterium]
MLGNNTPIFVKKRYYLFLIKPNRFILKCVSILIFPSLVW